MLDALVDRQDRHVTRAGETATAEHPLQRAEDPWRAIRQRDDAVDEVRSGQMQRFFWNRPALVLQKPGIAPENAFDTGGAEIRAFQFADSHSSPLNGRSYHPCG